MKKVVIFLLLMSSFAQAQYTVKGFMNPPYKSDWVILYKIEGARQVFVKNTTVKKDTALVEGKKQVVSHFTFTLPEDAKTGSYRVSYDTKGNRFVDFLFNKENVTFQFHPQYPYQTVAFTESKENRLYREYLEAIHLVQKKLDEIQVKALKTPSEKDAENYKKQLEKVNEVQQIYLKKSNGMMVHHFVVAGARKNSPTLMTSMQDYLNFIIDHFFDNIDFNDPVLYNSPFLIDRITDYVFYLNYSDDSETQKILHKNAIEKVLKKIKNPVFKKDVIEFLIKQFVTRENVEMVDYLFKNYYDKLPEGLQNKQFKEETLANLAAAIGRIAPDFSWKENNKNYQLSSLNDADTYVLVFWSTKCSHCRKEIPQVHEFFKDQKGVKVIGFAMEDDDFNFKNYIPKLKGWHHVLGLGRWQNKTARTYQIYATPSYFILDKNKKIIAKPEHLKDLKAFFKK